MKKSTTRPDIIRNIAHKTNIARQRVSAIFVLKVTRRDLA